MKRGPIWGLIVLFAVACGKSQAPMPALPSPTATITARLDLEKRVNAALATSTATRTRTKTATPTRTRTHTAGPTSTPQATFTPRPTSTVTATPASYALDLNFQDRPGYQYPSPYVTRRNLMVTPDLANVTQGPITDLYNGGITVQYPVDYLTRTPTPRPGHAPLLHAFAVWYKWNDGRFADRGGWGQAAVFDAPIYEPSFGPTSTPQNSPTRTPTFTRTATRTITPGGPPTYTPTLLPCSQVPPGAPMPCRTSTITPGGPTLTRTATVTPTPTSTPAGTPCGPLDATKLCLNSRFLVTADWATSDGRTGHGNAGTMTGNTGYFWFFSSDNVEVVVKVLNACAVNNKFWVFAAGLTNVQVTLTVTDVQLGTQKQYVNPLGTSFQPIQDTNAFDSCATQMHLSWTTLANEWQIFKEECARIWGKKRGFTTASYR